MKQFFESFYILILFCSELWALYAFDFNENFIGWEAFGCIDEEVAFDDLAGEIEGFIEFDAKLDSWFVISHPLMWYFNLDINPDESGLIF